MTRKVQPIKKAEFYKKVITLILQMLQEPTNHKVLNEFHQIELAFVKPGK